MIRNVLYTKGSSIQPYFYLQLLVSRIPPPLRYFCMRIKQIRVFSQVKIKRIQNNDTYAFDRKVQRKLQMQMLGVNKV